MSHLTAAELDDGFSQLQPFPADGGELRLIVRRPVVGSREVVSTASLDRAVGLVGDSWLARGSRHTLDGAAVPDAQITLMNISVAMLVAGRLDRVPLAGDQLYVDLDLSIVNLPVSTRLVIGDAVLEVTPPPHTGCAKFVDRFGEDAMRFVNSAFGRSLRLRGMNARVVTAGVVKVGDQVKVLR